MLHITIALLTCRTVERGVGEVGGPGPAKILFHEEIDCSLGPGAMKYLGPALALDGPANL